MKSKQPNSDEDNPIKKDWRGQVYNIQFQWTYLDPNLVPSRYAPRIDTILTKTTYVKKNHRMTE